MLRVILLAALIGIPLYAGGAGFYNLRAKSIHCATPEPILTGEVYPLDRTGCAMVLTVWGLVRPPEKAEPGVLRVYLGRAIGWRYSAESDVFEE